MRVARHGSEPAAVGQRAGTVGDVRRVEVPPERVAGWFDRFAARHGGVASASLTPGELRVEATDGAIATCEIPFGPLSEPAELAPVAALVAHLAKPRRIGLLLVRLGGHSVGVAEGGRVVVSRTDRRLVHGRSAAGGWSQQRFARRREGQAREALQAAATDAAAILGSAVLDGVVLGGDRKALNVLRADPRLAAVFAQAEHRVLDVRDPRRAVLDEAAERARGVEIVLREPDWQR